MAIVCLVVVLVALGIGALVSLEFWEGAPVEPRLGVESGPGLESGVGKAIAVGPEERVAIAPAQEAPGIGRGVAAREISVPVAEGDSPQHLAIAPAQVVSRHEPVAQPEPPGPGASPAPQPAPGAAPEAVPVAAPSPSPATTSPGGAPAEQGGGVPSGPVGAGSGPGSGEPEGAIDVGEGEEGAFAFSFLAQPTAYRAPGEENLIVQFAGEAGEDPSFGLQLWDDGGGQRGLWASGDAMGGERFLAPLADGVWHQVVVDFEASSGGDGFYLGLLDGEPVDARAWVSLIESGSDSAAIEVGLFRDGERVDDGADVLFGPTEFGETLESVLP